MALIPDHRPVILLTDSYSTSISECENFMEYDSESLIEMIL